MNTGLSLKFTWRQQISSRLFKITTGNNSQSFDQKMATFLSRRESQERARQEKAQRREQKLRHSDLLWAARRRYLDDKEWYELHVLDRTYGKFGPERAAYEFGILEELRDFFRRHEVGSKCPNTNALQRHLAIHAEQTKNETKRKNKKLVKP